MASRQASPCLCTTLRNASRSLTNAYDAALAPSGLLVTQYSLLRRVDANGSIALGELAVAVGLEKSTMTRNVQPLIRDGLLRVTERPGDRRVRVAALTAKGRRALANARPLWLSAQQRTAALLGERELEALRAALARLDPAE